MKHKQSRKSTKTKTSKEELHSLMLCDTPEAPPTGSTVHAKKDLISCLYRLSTAGVGLKLKDVFIDFEN